MRWVHAVPDPAEPIEWNVCFCKCDVTHPLDRFLKPGFRHVFVLGYVGHYDVWLLYDVSQDKSSVAVVSPGLAGNLLKMASEEGDVLKFTAQKQSSAPLWWRFGFWCTRAVAHLLGVRCVAATPWQLHQFLLRNGAVSLVRQDVGSGLRRREDHS